MHQPPYPPTLPNLIRELAARHGDREALIRGERRLTFSSLEEESARLAVALLEQGIRKGAHIGLLMPNSPDWAVVFLAAARIGAVVVPMSTLYQASELRWVVRHADLQVLFTASAYLRHDYVERLERAFPDLHAQEYNRLRLHDAPHLCSIVVWDGCDRRWATPSTRLLASAAGARIDSEFLRSVESSITPADRACIIYTSGSTAEPKAVLHLHGPLVRHSHHMATEYWPLGEGDRIGSIRPFFWVAGLSATLFHSLHVGACLIQVDPDGPDEVRRLVDEEALTALAGTPNWVRTIASHPAFADGRYRIYRVANDTAVIARRENKGYEPINPRSRRLLSGLDLPFREDLIPANFGMTETLGTHSTEPAPNLIPADKIGANGRPVPGVIQRLVDPRTRQPAKLGDIGELLVRGYSLMDGLYKRERHEVFTADGMYATGDLCRVDADGYLSFVSRAGDMLKVNGANVAPIEVELQLNAMPEVEDSAVLGLMRDGDILLVAAVVLRPGFSVSERRLIDLLKTLLSAFKVPRRIVFLMPEEVPRTGSGKIRKSELVPIVEAYLRG